jgi:CheY-like chemotaxis protein
MTKTRHITVVDDEDVVRKALTRLLQSAGLAGETARITAGEFTGLLRRRTESQMNLTAASVSTVMGLPALCCFASQVLSTRIVSSPLSFFLLLAYLVNPAFCKNACSARC